MHAWMNALMYNPPPNRNVMCIDVADTLKTISLRCTCMWKRCMGSRGLVFKSVSITKALEPKNPIHNLPHVHVAHIVNRIAGNIGGH